MTHAQLLALGLLVVRVRGHHACSRLSCLPLQSHLPLGVSYLLNLHGNFYSGWRRPRLGLLLLLGHGRLAQGLVGRLWTPTCTNHDISTRLLLRWCCGTQAWFTLGLVVRGGARGSVDIGWHVVGVLLELLGGGTSSSNLLLLLDLWKHLLMLG